MTNQTTKTCVLCKGTGRTTAVDAILPDGRVINPRPAVCMACDGAGVCEEDTDANS